MIFNSNTTSLAASNIPMAEGYDCSYGAALALVEGARNDYKMFRAMLDIDARELQIKRENADMAIQESEIIALKEAALSGIWNKIKELLSKLLAKIKAIFHTFMSKINSLFMKDKDLINKYENEVMNKRNIGNLVVKWRSVKNSPSQNIIASANIGTDVKSIAENLYDENSDSMFNNVAKEYCKSLNTTADNVSDLKQDIEKYYFEDDNPQDKKISEISGGMKGIINNLKEYSKLEQALTKNKKDTETNLSKLIKSAEDAKNKATDTYAKATDDGSEEREAMNSASHTLEVVNKLNEVAIAVVSANIDAAKIYYKQHKAAFVKAIAANDKKLKENAIYLDAIAEAAEEEVEDVINGAINSVDVTNTNNASTNVLDPSVSNDPDALVYGDDPEYNKAKTDGCIGTDYVSKEAAFFAQPLY